MGSHIKVGSRFLLLVLVLPVLGWSQALADDEKMAREAIALGSLVFTDNCRQCHQADGHGERALYPSLRRADLLADKTRMIQAILHGRERPARESGGKATRLMPALNFLTDKEVVAVVAYISSTWGTDIVLVEEEDVQRARPPLAD